MLQMSGLGKLLNVKQETIVDRVDRSDKVFIVAYPSVNLSEMVAVTELRSEIAQKVNGLDLYQTSEDDRGQSVLPISADCEG